jgi:hypothetical protein
MIFEFTAVLLACLMVTTPAKGKKTTGLVPTKSNKGSPKKKPLNSIRITEETLANKRRKSDYHLRIMKLRPDFELIWVESTPGNDGYAQKLFDFITKADGFRAQGVLMVAHRRISKENTDTMKNSKDTYARRCIVRVVQDDDDSTHTSRLAILRALRAFLIRPENNQFDYEYVVNDASDLTPPVEDDLEPMDHFLHDSVIVNLISTVFDDTANGWYAENPDSALDFFSGPTFPAYAVDTLGYPAGGINANGMSAHFHLPDNNEP